ncbi:bifunctional 3-(3-hydroxy-phenyl)propionate/3-hydroxycinnamic acid hydroxylase [Streptomyces sp. NPDC050560]|uniref:bifunctional 3-(3-hydroxy-phenyl)propionate/3-hydroxycinnamic acid hydroxylase n=1 Tax=Streptomyces sp. NPDC050560 TaxID=3365630 RepID=UPI0037A1ECEC
MGRDARRGVPVTGHGAAAAEYDADVLVVGYGPVGQVLSILLAQRGWRVTAVERHPRRYPFPRAVGFDGEVARVLAAAGIGHRMAEFGEASIDYEFRNAEGRTLMRIDLPDEPGPSGWPKTTAFHQPALEAALDGRAAELPTMRRVMGHEVVGLVERPGHVEARLRTTGGDSDGHGGDGSGDGDVVGSGEGALTARYVVGCDGANSFVRSCLGSTVTDLGFRYDWLLCDVELHDRREFSPNNMQICDPGRPTTLVAAGPGHRRWEFMRLPGESARELAREDTAWALLAPHDVTPGNATLYRHAVYTFGAQWVDGWRSGRLLLAGDAAHLMPPFAGQGMCAGVRDASNLAWKLDLLLRGLVDDALLDTYAVERRPHVKLMTELAVGLGQLVCELDPVKVAERDAFMVALAADPDSQGPQVLALPLADGVLRTGPDGRPAGLAGSLVPQAVVEHEGTRGMFDEVVGTGFVLLSDTPPEELLSAADLRFLASLRARTVWLRPPDAGGGPGVLDTAGVYLPYLAEHGATALLARPDFYVFGTAEGPADVPALVADLRERLTAPAGHPARTN